MSFNLFGFEVNINRANNVVDEHQANLKSAKEIAAEITRNLVEAKKLEAKEKADKAKADAALRQVEKADQAFEQTLQRYAAVKVQAAQAKQRLGNGVAKYGGKDYASMLEAVKSGECLESMIVHRPAPSTAPSAPSAPSTSATSTTEAEAVGMAILAEAEEYAAKLIEAAQAKAAAIAAGAGSNKTRTPVNPPSNAESKTQLVEAALLAAGFNQKRVDTIIAKSKLGKTGEAVDGWCNALIAKGEGDAVALAAAVCVSIPFYAKKWNKWVNTTDASTSAGGTSTSSNTLVDEDAGTSAGALVDDEPEVKLEADEASPQGDIQSPDLNLDNI